MLDRFVSYQYVIVLLHVLSLKVIFKYLLTIYDNVDDLHLIFVMAPETQRKLINKIKNLLGPLSSFAVSQFCSFLPMICFCSAKVMQCNNALVLWYCSNMVLQ